MTLESSLYLAIFLTYGIVIGSFLNVCIYRIPQGISIAVGRSFCPTCNHFLGVFDLFPIFSYLFLGRKCRYCKEKISSRYAYIELLTGVLFVLVYMKFGISLKSILVCLLASVLVVVSFIDIDTGEIPDRLHVFIFILFVIQLVFEKNLSLKESVIGFFIISVPMLILAYITGGFGGGDIKLMAVCGLFLGFLTIVLAFFIGAFIGAIHGVIMIARKKATSKTAVSFGQFLSIGIFLSCLYGQSIIDLYLSLFI